MSKKVKVTREQAEGIESIKNTILKNIAELKHFPARFYEEERPVSELDLKDIESALFDGYEVEEEFKEGDWCIWEAEEGPNPKGAFMLREEGTRDDEKGFFPDEWPSPYCGGYAIPVSQLRHATAQEIAQEKERRWWTKHGRGVWELKQGDFLVNSDKVAWEVTKVPEGENHCFLDYTKIYYDRIKKSYLVLCFVENRLDQ